MPVVIALCISFVVPLLYLYVIRKLDLYGTGRFIYNLVALMWGGISYFLAGSINNILLINGYITRGQLVCVAAPITEEILKALILLYLVRRADFNYVVDGAIYGFGAGIGFAIMENFEYIAGNPGTALPLAILRVLSTNLLHATASAIIGSILAILRNKRNFLQLLLAFGSIVPAAGLHMGFNAMVSDGGSLLIAIPLSLVGAGLIVVIICKGMKIEQGWIGETLGAADRVTRSETAVVQRIHFLDDVLVPINRQFGPEKAFLAETIILTQAEIGIKRKLLDETQDVTFRRKLEAEIHRLAAGMDEARKAVGPYCMLFLRTVYLEQNTRIWDAINQRVEMARKGHAGGGLWSTLGDRIRESNTKGDGS